MNVLNQPKACFELNKGFWENGKLERRASIKHNKFTIRCGFRKGKPDSTQQGELELEGKFKYCGAFNEDFSFAGAGTVTTDRFIFWGHWETRSSQIGPEHDQVVGSLI